MADESMPEAVWSGSFEIFGITVRCHNLSDGRRVIEHESVTALLTAMENGAEPGDLSGFSLWQKGR